MYNTATRSLKFGHIYRHSLPIKSMCGHQNKLRNNNKQMNSTETKRSIMCTKNVSSLKLSAGSQAAAVQVWNTPFAHQLYTYSKQKATGCIALNYYWF